MRTIFVIMMAACLPAFAETTATVEGITSAVPAQENEVVTRSLKATQFSGRFRNLEKDGLCNIVTQKQSAGSAFIQMVTRAEIRNGSGLYVPDDTYVAGQLWDGLSIAKLPLTIGNVALIDSKIPGITDRASYNGHVLKIIRHEDHSNGKIIRVIQIRTDRSLNDIEGAKYTEYDTSDVLMRRPLPSAVECDPLCPFKEKSICLSQGPNACPFKDKSVCSPRSYTEIDRFE